MLDGFFELEALIFGTVIFFNGVALKTKDYYIGSGVAGGAREIFLQQSKLYLLILAGMVATLSMFIWGFLNFGWLAVILIFLMFQIYAALIITLFIVPLYMPKNYDEPKRGILFVIFLSAHLASLIVAVGAWTYYFIS